MKTKKLHAALIILLLATSAIAEEAKKDDNAGSTRIPPKTLIDVKNSYYSGYMGIFTKSSKIGDAYGCLVGGKGGLIINDKFVIGGGGMGLTYPTGREKISGSDYTGTLDRVGFGYGGFLMEYYLNPKDIVVFSGGLLVGAGGITLYDENTDENRKADKFFVAEPEINVLVNVTRFCRVGVGVSYRFVNGIHSGEFADKDFRGPACSVMAQFGWF